MIKAIKSSLLVSCTIVLTTPAFAQTSAQPTVPSPAQAAARSDEAAETSNRSTTDQSDLAEIVVTARKREERVQSVPISIAVFSGDALERRNVKNLSDVSKFVPNLTFETGARSGGGSVSAQVFIRGIGQTDYTPYSDQGVGIYVDGIYLGRTQGSLLDVLDVERIEVLRGPQGTLFGKNTIGGAISIVSAKPSGEFGGYVQGAVGRFDQKDFKASVDVPMGDTLAAKLTFATRNRDGYARSLFNGDRFGDLHSVAGRGVLRWTPTSDIAFTTIFDITHQDQHAQFQRPVAITTTPSQVLQLYNGFVASRTPYVAYDRRWLPTETYTNFTAGPNINDLDSYGISGNLEWRLADSLTLTSISAYRHLKYHIAQDTDGSPLPMSEVNDSLRQHQFSQELRLAGTSFEDRLKWLVGGYYFRERISDDNGSPILVGLFPALEALPFRVGPFGGRGNPANLAVDLTLLQRQELTNKTYAAFTQATFSIADKLSLTGGVRYNDDRKDVIVSLLKTASGVYSIPLGTTRSLRATSWTPKASIEFQATPDLLFYASYAKGFKAGGFNSRASDITELLSYGPEKISTYELGLKSEWFDRRLRVNAAGFYSDYTDLQFNYQVPGGAQGCVPTKAFCSIVGNAAQVRIKGFELDTAARVFEGFDILASAGYIDDKFKKIDPFLLAQGAINFNTHIPKTPKWSANLGAQYSTPISSFGRVTGRVDYAYRSRTFQDFENTPALVQRGYGLLSARLALGALDDTWEIALSGQNLTNKVYYTSGTDTQKSLGYALAGFGIPRTWTLTATYRFGKH